MKIDINTRMIPLLGNPLEQYRSASIQNKYYEAVKLNFISYNIPFGNEHLKEIVNGLRYMNIAGFSVVKENRKNILKYLDDLDHLCRITELSDTVVKTREGRLVGYNTESIGFYSAITRQAGIKIEQCVFFCFGSNEEAKAICSVLACYNARKIYITDVHEESAKNLVEEINEKVKQVAEFVLYVDRTKLAACDVVINASGLGVGSDIGKTPLPKEYMKKEQIYFDICYKPLKTQFLLDAEAKDGRAFNGLEMLLLGLAAQIKLWTEEKANVEVMRKIIFENIK